MAKKTWRCVVCGYIHEGEAPPDTCPICGVSKDDFVAVELEPVERPSAGRWKCAVCGYVHEGEAPPATCPVCAVPKEHFAPLESASADAGSAAGHIKVVVVGAGIAGVTAVETLVATPGVQVVLIDAEGVVPYYRLNLTRYLAREVGRSDLDMKSARWFADQGVTVVHGVVERISLEDKAVTLEDGRVESYDKLILATGAHAYVPPFEGARTPGVFVLRTVADADAISAAVPEGGAVVVVGGGLLGLETAGALVKRGIRVTVLEGHPWVLPRQMPREAGPLLRDYLRKNGITVRLDTRIKAVVGDMRVAGVQVTGDEEIPCDAVVVAAGIRTNSYTARRAGLHVNRGVVVDDFLRTSHPDVFAAGDVAEHGGVVAGIWPVSYVQGRIAAANALGNRTPYTPVPLSNRIKVLGVDLFSIGIVEPPDGSYQVFAQERDGAYARMVVRDGKVVGGVLFGDAALAGDLQAAVESGTHVSQWPSLRERFFAVVP